MINHLKITFSAEVLKNITLNVPSRKTWTDKRLTSTRLSGESDSLRQPVDVVVIVVTVNPN